MYNNDPAKWHRKVGHRNNSINKKIKDEVLAIGFTLHPCKKQWELNVVTA